jgi:hypothetical protein
MFCAHTKAKSGGISVCENRESCNSDVTEMLHGVDEKSWFSSSATHGLLQVRVTVLLRRKEKLCVTCGAANASRSENILPGIYNLDCLVNDEGEKVKDLR